MSEQRQIFTIKESIFESQKQYPLVAVSSQISHVMAYVERRKDSVLVANDKRQGEDAFPLSQRIDTPYGSFDITMADDGVGSSVWPHYLLRIMLESRAGAYPIHAPVEERHAYIRRALKLMLLHLFGATIFTDAYADVRAYAERSFANLSYGGCWADDGTKGDLASSPMLDEPFFAWTSGRLGSRLLTLYAYYAVRRFFAEELFNTYCTQQDIVDWNQTAAMALHTYLNEDWQAFTRSVCYTPEECARISRDEMERLFAGGTCSAKALDAYIYARIGHRKLFGEGIDDMLDTLYAKNRVIDSVRGTSLPAFKAYSTVAERYYLASTIALAVSKDMGDAVGVACISIGDARCYMLDTTNGMWQLSRDDAFEDNAMRGFCHMGSAVKNTDGYCDNTMRGRYVKIPKPMALFCCTDGVYDTRKAMVDASASGDKADDTGIVFEKDMLDVLRQCTEQASLLYENATPETEATTIQQVLVKHFFCNADVAHCDEEPTPIRMGYCNVKPDDSGSMALSFYPTPSCPLVGDMIKEDTLVDIIARHLNEGVLVDYLAKSQAEANQDAVRNALIALVQEINVPLFTAHIARQLAENGAEVAASIEANLLDGSPILDPVFAPETLALFQGGVTWTADEPTDMALNKCVMRAKTDKMLLGRIASPSGLLMVGARALEEQIRKAITNIQTVDAEQYAADYRQQVLSTRHIDGLFACRQQVLSVFKEGTNVDGLLEAYDSAIRPATGESTLGERKYHLFGLALNENAFCPQSAGNIQSNGWLSEVTCIGHVLSAIQEAEQACIDAENGDSPSNIEAEGATPAADACSIEAISEGAVPPVDTDGSNA